MSFYDDMAQTAAEMIAEFGRNVTLSRDNAGVYDPITGTFLGAGVAASTVKAVFTQFKSQEIDGALVQRGDQKVLLGMGVMPRLNDTITDAERSYRILQIIEVAPGDGVVLYKVQVRA